MRSRHHADTRGCIVAASGLDCSCWACNSALMPLPACIMNLASRDPHNSSAYSPEGLRAGADTLRGALQGQNFTIGRLLAEAEPEQPLAHFFTDCSMAIFRLAPQVQLTNLKIIEAYSAWAVSATAGKRPVILCKDGS